MRIAWPEVWGGAPATAMLFVVGKYLIGLYIARASYSNSYGAAGSLVAVLVWACYFSLILFVGAEITQVYARSRSGAERARDPREAGSG